MPGLHVAIAAYDTLEEARSDWVAFDASGHVGATATPRPRSLRRL